jgi:hypothetical protein
VRIVDDEDGNPLDVGRRTRSIPPALRRALNSRDRGCCFPGCDQTRYVDGHHIRHWAEGGLTVLQLDDGAWRLSHVNGPIVERFDSTARMHSAVLGDWRELVATHDSAGVRIDRTTAATRWDGEMPDCGQAMMMLVQRAERAGTFPRKRPDSPPAVGAS